jgi:hypothetical protein
VPVAKGRSGGGRQVASLAIASILGVAAMVLLFTQVGGSGGTNNVQVDVGDSVFAPGNVDRLSADIADKGPLLLSDVSGGDRDIFLQHTGTDPSSGWTAFGVRPLTASRECYVEWQPDRAEFVDNCDGTVYPADGAGLPPYPVVIDADGNITVDIRSAIDGSATTLAPTGSDSGEE